MKKIGLNPYSNGTPIEQNTYSLVEEEKSLNPYSHGTPIEPRSNCLR